MTQNKNEATGSLSVNETLTPKLGGCRGMSIALGVAAVVTIITVILAWPGYQRNTHLNKGVDAYKAKRYAEAIPHLEYLVELAPAGWLRMNQLGKCYLETEQAEKAKEIYGKSLKANPKQNLSAQLGRINMMLGDEAEALKLLKEAIQADPFDPHANFYIALFYFERDQPAKAAFFFNAASSDSELAKKARPYLEEIRAALLPDSIDEAP